MPAMEAVTTASKTDSVKPAGVRAISRFAKADLFVRLKRMRFHLID
jgi:hypothetical protein